MLLEQVRAHNHAHVGKGQEEFVVLIEGSQGRRNIAIHHPHIDDLAGIHVSIDRPNDRGGAGVEVARVRGQPCDGIVVRDDKAVESCRILAVVVDAGDSLSAEIARRRCRTGFPKGVGIVCDDHFIANLEAQRRVHVDRDQVSIRGSGCTGVARVGRISGTVVGAHGQSRGRRCRVLGEGRNTFHDVSHGYDVRDVGG